MKKLLAITFAAMVIFTGCSSPKDSNETKVKEATPATEVIQSDIETKTTEETSSDTSSTKQEDSATTDSESEQIIITLPAVYLTGLSQEEIEQTFNTTGLLTTILNEDGSVTFTMSKSLHPIFVELIGQTIKYELDAFVDSEEFPNFKSISYNKDFTEFNITTTSSGLSQDETMSSIMFYLCGNMYNICNQTEQNTIVVNYINSETGDIIFTNDSTDLEKQLQELQELAN